MGLKDLTFSYPAHVIIPLYRPTANTELNMMQLHGEINLGFKKHHLAKAPSSINILSSLNIKLCCSISATSLLALFPPSHRSLLRPSSFSVSHPLILSSYIHFHLIPFFPLHSTPRFPNPLVDLLH